MIDLNEHAQKAQEITRKTNLHNRFKITRH